MYRLFIVEDDSGIACGIAAAARNYGYESVICSDFSRVIEEFSSSRFDLVLLDISLPFYGGYYYCTEIRKISSLPIIFISSASDSMSIVTAMNMGGDDFIAKPFDSGVLMAKIAAVLRRANGNPTVNNIKTLGDITLDCEKATLSYKGQSEELTKNEFRIMLCLIENAGKIVSREKLMEKLWESDAFVDENTLSVNVNRLRKKLSSMGLENFILTKVGMGYTVNEK